MAQHLLMRGETIFAALALLIAFTAAVLSLARHILPRTLQSSLRYWQAGTLSIALGFASCALDRALATPVVVILASVFVCAGLTGYHASLQLYRGRRPQLGTALPLGASAAGVLVFGLFHRDMMLLIVVTLAAWMWIMLACARTLTDDQDGGPRLSRQVMIGLFVVAIAAELFMIALRTTFDANPGAADRGWALGTSVLMSLLPVIGTIVFLLMCVGRLKSSLELAASTDHLTDLFNRRLLGRIGEEAFQHARTRGSSFSVAVIDIDRFKSINDSFGHAVGDQVLVQVAKRLKESLRKTDFIARSGGEEFVVILDDPRPGGVQATIERLRNAIEHNPFRVESAAIMITISAGVATYCHDDTDFDGILRRADAALYHAKALGRNRVAFASEPPFGDQTGRRSDHGASARLQRL